MASHRFAWIDFTEGVDRFPRLAPGEAHLWTADLNAPKTVLPRLHSLLSVDERQRAHLRPGRHSDRYATARGLLRLLIGAYLNAAPAAIRFTYNDYGKPALVEPQSAPPLEFNLSHSDDRVLVVFTLGRRVGGDIEAVRPSPWLKRLAERFFTPNEQVALLADEERYAERFFACWTIKEAYLKAVGVGISHPLNAIEVMPSPAEPRLIAIDGNPEEAQRWRVVAPPPLPGYAAAALIESSGPLTTRFFAWQWSTGPSLTDPPDAVVPPGP